LFNFHRNLILLFFSMLNWSHIRSHQDRIAFER